MNRTLAVSGLPAVLTLLVATASVACSDIEDRDRDRGPGPAVSAEGDSVPGAAWAGPAGTASPGPAGGYRGGASSGSDTAGAREGRRAEPPVFPADAAFALLERQVAFGPRVPGTAGHAAQLAWMLSYLRERADTVWVQEFRHDVPGRATLELTNVFAQFRPRVPDRILLVAHWDTRPTADMEPDPDARDRPIPGANDGASGTAVLLQLADVLSRHSPPIGVDLLLVDGEDYAPSHMYLGAAHFAAHVPPGYEPLYGIVVDMVADRDPRFPQEAYSRQYAPEVVDRVWRTAERLGHREHFPPIHGRAITDDHVPLNQAGIRTIDIIDFDYGPGNAYWHTHDDDLPNVGPEGLGVVGEVLVAGVWQGG